MTGQAPAVPPHNLDAERELLGSLLAYYTPDALKAVLGTEVTREDFYWRPHEITFRAIVALDQKGTHVDVLTVARFLECQQGPQGSFLDAIGGEATLHVLVSHAVPHGVRERAVMIREDGEWRRRLRSALEQQEACYSRDEQAWRAALGEQPPLRVIEGGRAAAS